MKLSLAIALTILLSSTVSPVMSKDTATNSADSSVQEQKSTVLPNGFYLVLRENSDSKKVEPVSGKEKMLTYDYEFFEPSERGEKSFIAVSTDSFIPIVLSETPVKEPDGKGKPKLLLQLAEDQVTPLEEFTTTNCGKSIAIVIGGKVVTTHKIREPIKGGKVQITRCSDNGCEVLYTQLQHKTQ